MLSTLINKSKAYCYKNETKSYYVTTHDKTVILSNIHVAMHRPHHIHNIPPCLRHIFRSLHYTTLLNFKYNLIFLFNYNCTKTILYYNVLLIMGIYACLGCGEAADHMITKKQRTYLILFLCHIHGIV